MLMGIARERTTLIGLILSAVLLVGAHLPHLPLFLALPHTTVPSTALQTCA
jgi:hypothetical protein